MKVCTAEQMRDIDARTIERGIPGVILMENAGNRVVDFLLESFPDLTRERVAVICGKGNNGGDGFVIARQLFTRGLCAEVTVFELYDAAELKGDAAVNRTALEACGCPVQRGLPAVTSTATIVVDAVLGTGLSEPARGPALDAIRAINTLFPLARKVSVDIPSGLPSEETAHFGEAVHADHTVTFVAPKRSQVLAPAFQFCGQLHVVPIGTPGDLLAPIRLNVTDRADISSLFKPRVANSNKGMYGHVLVLGGSYGKSGAPAMAAFGAYRSGAGLVTAAIPESALPMVAAVRPEFMTEPSHDPDRMLELMQKMSVLALGPGLGTSDEASTLVRRLYVECQKPAVVDADALNILAGDLPSTQQVRVLTPHPGEMSRLSGKSVKEIQADRVAIAEAFAREHGVTLVLKGDRTVIAFPDGETWINPTGCPAMATGGTGDILTGMIAGLVAQHPDDWRKAVIAAVWLHGRSGELGSRKWGEESLLATDLLDFLPEAMNEVRPPV